MLEIMRVKASEECLGAYIQEVYAHQNLILAKDKTHWKYYKMISQGQF